MSHFSVFVVVPKIEMDNAKEYIDRTIAKFDENLEGMAHKEICGCIGGEAQYDARAAADEMLGTIDDFRKKFETVKKKVAKEMKLPAKNMSPKQFKRYDQRLDKEWKIFIKPWEETSKQLAKKHPKFGKPDPKCPQCKGTGEYISRYNPDSKYDWYRVGGRWDGYIISNPKQSQDGFNFDEAHETIENNSVKIKDLKKGKSAFAVVDSEGEWYQKGDMGWFGMSTNNITEKKWIQLMRKILKEEDQEAYVVCLDCHI